MVVEPRDQNHNDENHRPQLPHHDMMLYVLSVYMLVDITCQVQIGHITYMHTHSSMKVTAAKLPPPPPLRAKILDHLWIGNQYASEPGFMSFAEISARVALQKFDGFDSETDFLPFPTDALLDAEIPAAQAKADEICAFVSNLLKNGHDVLIQCEDGLSAAPCIATRYLTKYCGVPPAQAIARMRMCYMTAQQAQQQAAEDANIAHVTKYQPEKLPEVDMSESARKRRALLTLTNLSQQKMLI